MSDSQAAWDKIGRDVDHIAKWMIGACLTCWIPFVLGPVLSTTGVISVYSLGWFFAAGLFIVVFCSIIGLMGSFDGGKSTALASHGKQFDAPTAGESE